MSCSNGLEITCDKESVWKIQNVLPWITLCCVFVSPLLVWFFTGTEGVLWPCVCRLCAWVLLARGEFVQSLAEKSDSIQSHGRNLWNYYYQVPGNLLILLKICVVKILSGSMILEKGWKQPFSAMVFGDMEGLLEQIIWHKNKTEQIIWHKNKTFPFCGLFKDNQAELGWLTGSMCWSRWGQGMKVRKAACL